jgi:hypothetical protein
MKTKRIFDIPPAVVAIESLRRQALEKEDLAKQGEFITEVVSMKEYEISINVNKSESDLNEAMVSIKALETEKALASISNNQFKVKQCSEEIHRLNLLASEKNAVFQYKKSYAATQRQDLETLQFDILPDALQTGSINTFRGIVADSAIKDIQRASLENQYAFTQPIKKMLYQLEELKVLEAEYQDALNPVEQS